MTDKEIKKALECCVGDNDGKNCFDCPLWEIDDCQEQLLLGALNIINRLQVKNQGLTTAHPKTIESIKKMRDKAKAEAYKEFAENVSKLICDNTYPDFDKDGKAVNIWNAKDGYKQIDNLLKEMVGDNNA